MTLFERLKASTSHEHEVLEKKLDLLSPDFTFEDYINLLKKFYGVYAPVEDLVKESIIYPHYNDRMKLPLLHQDLMALGLTEEDIRLLPRCPSLMTPDHLNELMGTLYVLEGSTLGAMILTKHFRLRFDLGFLKGLSFFSGYGEETPLRWREWREFSESFSKEMRLSDDVMIEQARKTFQLLTTWL